MLPDRARAGRHVYAVDPKRARLETHRVNAVACPAPDEVPFFETRDLLNGVPPPGGGLKRNDEESAALALDEYRPPIRCDRMTHVHATLFRSQVGDRAGCQICHFEPERESHRLRTVHRRRFDEQELSAVGQECRSRVVVAAFRKDPPFAGARGVQNEPSGWPRDRRRHPPSVGRDVERAPFAETRSRRPIGRSDPHRPGGAGRVADILEHHGLAIVRDATHG